jgi:hypothetical protein
MDCANRAKGISLYDFLAGETAVREFTGLMDRERKKFYNFRGIGLLCIDIGSSSRGGAVR